MKIYRISQQARIDLIEIWLYIAQDSVQAADDFTAQVRSKFPLLAEWPDSGRNRDDLEPGLRSHPVGNYIIFYRNGAKGVEIARVLHGARDLGRLL